MNLVLTLRLDGVLEMQKGMQLTCLMGWCKDSSPYCLDTYLFCCLVSDGINRGVREVLASLLL